MWRPLCLCVLALLLLPPAVGAGTSATDDGTLSVKKAGSPALITVVARGSIVGQCDRCYVTIIDPKPEDGSGPVITGYERKRDLSDEALEPDEFRARWFGEDMRFRLIGGFSRITVRGTGINLTAVGKGSGTIRGSEGTYALNGGDRKAVPDELKAFQLVDTTSPAE